ncbi:MAG: type IV pilus biogenesis/stability protein PilW [Candidatus Rariloculaceae bacterium]
MKKIALLAALCVSLSGCVSTTNSSGTEQSDADAAVANLNLGVGYLRQGRPDFAVEILERALEFDPNLADAHSALAVAYDQTGAPEEAEEQYLRAAELEPDSSAAANSYAVFLCRTDRWSDAEEYFRRAADNPRYATPEAALANAGVCARAAGESETAKAYFREALGRNPTYPDALMHMTDLAYQNDNLTQARAFMQRSLSSGVENPQLYWLCFQIERDLNSVTDAQRCATRLKEQFPESAEASQIFEMERNATP